MKARFIEIPREERTVTRYTAYDNMMKKRMQKANEEATKLLEDEQWRLIQTWNRS